MPFFQISHVYKRIEIPPFFASEDASTLTQYIFNVYLVANPKREFEYIMVVTVGLQDISSMYITPETSYDLILYVYYLRYIKISIYIYIIKFTLHSGRCDDLNVFFLRYLVEGTSDQPEFLLYNVTYSPM